MKLLQKLPRPDRAGRTALRFFAALIILTLVARGTAGAAMARVKLQKVGPGMIVQKASAAASLIAEDGEVLELPAGITVQKLWVASGQTVQKDAPIVQLSCSELQDALDKANIHLAQQKARLAQLNSHTAPDTSGVSAAQQNLAESNEDAARELRRADETVSRAKIQQQAAQETYNSAVSERDTLYEQTEPVPTAEELQQADLAVQTAQDALSAAGEALYAAETAREDTALSSKRRTESAQQALNQANTQLAEAKAQDALVQQSSQADALSVKREIEKTENQIHLLNQFLKTDGLFAAPREAQIIRCDLAIGEVVPERSPLLLSKEGSVLLARFSLPEKEAEKLSAGLAVTLYQNQKSASATVQTASKPNAEKQCQVTAAVAEEDSAFLQADAAANAELIFSRTNHSCCVPISALRQDAEGFFVLAVEQQKTAFGITSTAVRIPVTVLETDSEGTFAAVDGTLPDSIIVESDRAVKPGAAVRMES